MNLETILRNVFEAQGATDPDGLAKRAVNDFELDDRNRRIDLFRANHTESETAFRFDLSPVRIRQIVREQLDLRRARLDKAD